VRMAPYNGKTYCRIMERPGSGVVRLRAARPQKGEL
jgi:hypothetical protein